ncbi:nucleo protein TPR [Podospora australis]|uniref:Nucleo protein TPR n=1 Tax=Podospora australis TaxID=1536484 RepID=A0AAN6WZ15_9PEZI|nr:nucleo protein TPR [Podospora australis]
MAAAEVDLSYLSTQAGVPELDLSSAVTSPTAELVKSVLEAIVIKFRDLEQEKVQLEIELEGAIRGSESRCEQFKATADKALKEVEEIRQKLQSEESTRRALENELQNIKSSGTASLSEIETLRARIASLETSNRETLAIVDSKTTANASLAEELQKQHQKILKLNQEISQLNQSVQTAQTTANSAKYREEALKQELELANKNNEWYDAELKTKAAESLKFRKEKGARIAELQRLNEDANSNIESLTRTEQQLRKRLEEAQSKADEALSKVQQLQESAARAEESFKQELESSKRLVELKDQQSKTHRNRLKEVELRLEQVKDDNAEEIRRIRRELEQEKEAHLKTEQQLEELQTETDRLRVSHDSHDHNPGSAPQTPRANGSLYARPGSPFGTPASIRGKVRATETLDELLKVKAQLNGELRRSQKLQEDLDDAVSMLEAKLPEIDELTAESERLRSEAIQMSEIMQQSYEERDAAVKAARKAESTAATAQAEAKILRTQIRDLGTQIHVLIFNIHAREKGLDQLTEEEARQFERLQRGEISEDALEDMSDTHQFITQRFTAFKDIYELQEKNEELLKLTRELANRMEDEEAKAAQQQAVADHEEVDKLRQTVSDLSDEVQSITVRMQSYMTERDMFRRMLQQKADPVEIRKVLGVDDQREVLASIEQQQSDEADLTVALRELQAQFDSYRNDQSIDRNALKEQVTQLTAERSALQSEISRVSSQLTLATERYSILESNFKAAQTEKQELQRRAQTLSEAAAKQDMRTQQAAEDLVEARGLVESLRSENANLKAEKTLWKTIQDRLSSDNESLAQEKTRLNGLLSSQQSLLNERELSESETKRRLQGQIDALDAELSTTKRKLSEEIDEGRKIQLRKEFDAQQFQKRIDELSNTINQIKEENIRVKTTRDHLQARVNELEIEVRNAQERTERLRPLPTPRPGTLHEQPNSNVELQERIEDLENEVQDLKNELDLAKVQLENSQQEAANFKQLSKDLEEELLSFGESHALYTSDTEQKLEAKEVTINELQQRVEALTIELGASNHELNMLRDSQADVARRVEEKERILNSDIARLKDEEEKYKEIARYHQQDLRAQAEIATKAQQEYEHELVKHAEAAKALQEIRIQYNELRTKSAQWRAEAESARLSLKQSETSWEERRSQLEQEIAEIKARKDDAVSQNKLLHDQLDSVTAQISSLQRNRMTDTTGSAATTIADTATEGLRELNNYLRREKEILEVQYDIKLQEAKRLQQQLEYSQSQLDEARLKLEQERRAHTESSQSSLTHKDLMEKLNELNLIRESNVTLRNEHQRAQAQLERKSKKIEELEARIQPLEVRISELDFDKNFKEQEIKQLQEARDGLQKRIESILSKYGQADPQEVEQLKAMIASLEAERDALQAKLTEAEQTLENKSTEFQTSKTKLVDDFKSKYRAVKASRDEALAEKTALQTNLESVNQRLAGVEQELATAKQNLATVTEKNQQLEQQKAAAPAPQTTAAAPPDGEQVAELTRQLESVKSELEAVTTQKNAAEAQVGQLKAELANAIAERDQAREAAAQQAAVSNDVAMDGGEVAAPQPVSAPILSDEEREALEEKLAAAEARAAEFEAKAKELEDQADVIVKQRSDKMKTALNKKLAESKEALEKQYQEQRANVEAEFKLKLEQEIAIVKAEQLTAGPPLHNIPATPAKPSGDQPPQTPTAATPANGEIPNLTDSQVQHLVATNSVVKNIVKSNIQKLVAKQKAEIESTLKSEYEQKIVSAKEQATALTEKKSALRLNMLDRQHKTAQAKIQVVETAAKETPQKPVVEVWEIAKDAKPPAPPPAAPSPAVSAAPSPAPVQATPTNATSVPAAQATPTASSTVEETKPQIPAPQTAAPPPPQQNKIPTPNVTGLPAPGSSIPNPFGAPSGATVTSNLPVANPFGAPGAAVAQVQVPVVGIQTGLPQPVRTGLPQPRAGGNAGRGGRGGVYQARGGPGFRGGRGGFQRGGGQAGAAGGGGMNPQAGEFNPGNVAAGNKRPRNDSEAGGGERGGKRPRGGGGTPAAAAAQTQG